MIDIAGGRAALISGSAGCVLALDAASALGDRVSGLYLFEPPLIVNDSRPPAPADYVEHQEALVAAGRRSEAVEYFMTFLGVPQEYLEPMKQDPSWDEMAALAHTYAYDERIVRDVQQGKPLPTDRWQIAAPTVVAVGGNGEQWLGEGAEELATILPDATLSTLPDQDHSAFWMAPDVVADAAREFLLAAGRNHQPGN